MAVAFAVVVVPWVAFSVATFGSPFPQTLAAKLAQAESGWWDHGLFYRGLRRSLVGFDARGLGLSYKFFLVILLSSGVVAVWRRHPVGLLLGWAMLESAGYAILNVPYYHWYGVPLHLAFALLVAMLFEVGWRERGPIPRAIAVVLCGAYLWLSVPTLDERPISAPAYRAAAAWLAFNTDETATIGCVEIGTIGYFTTPLWIVDACGLISPEGVPHIARANFAWW